MAAMKRVFLAATLLSALPGIAAAESMRSYYTDRCWTGDLKAIPPLVELNATAGGTPLWNAKPTDWKTFHAWLNGIRKSWMVDMGMGIIITVDEKMPHRMEIVSALEKQGYVLRRCRWFPEPPKFEPDQPRVY